MHAHWNCHGSSPYQPASMPEPQILQKLQTSRLFPNLISVPVTYTLLIYKMAKGNECDL